MQSVFHIQSSLFKAIQHGFFGRAGGVSIDEVGSLNTYPYHRETGRLIDSVENVIENRRRILGALKIDALDIVTANQMHGDIILKVNKSQPMDFAQADGLIVENPNLPIGVLTADCVPVMYTDDKHKVAGIVHAGWKGTFLDIHLKMLQEFKLLGYAVNQISAVIGPSSQLMSYEVDQTFYDKWLSKDLKYKDFFVRSSRPEHYQFDVPGVIYSDLKNAGVSQIDWVRIDTIINESLFFSHRRATLNLQPYSGRQLSVISL